jgi:hypothetical protein
VHWPIPKIVARLSSGDEWLRECAGMALALVLRHPVRFAFYLMSSTEPGVATRTPDDGNRAEAWRRGEFIRSAADSSSGND